MNSMNLISWEEGLEILNAWQRAKARLLYETFRADVGQRRDFFVRIKSISLGSIGMSLITIDGPEEMEFFVKLTGAEFFRGKTARWSCILRLFFPSGNEVILSGETLDVDMDAAPR